MRDAEGNTTAARRWPDNATGVAVSALLVAALLVSNVLMPVTCYAQGLQINETVPLQEVPNEAFQEEGQGSQAEVAADGAGAATGVGAAEHPQSDSFESGKDSGLGEEGLEDERVVGAAMASTSGGSDNGSGFDYSEYPDYYRDRLVNRYLGYSEEDLEAALISLQDTVDIDTSSDEAIEDYAMALFAWFYLGYGDYSAAAASSKSWSVMLLDLVALIKDQDASIYDVILTMSYLVYGQPTSGQFGDVLTKNDAYVADGLAGLLLSLNNKLDEYLGGDNSATAIGKLKTSIDATNTYLRESIADSSRSGSLAYYVSQISTRANVIYSLLSSALSSIDSNIGVINQNMNTNADIIASGIQTLIDAQSGESGSLYDSVINTVGTLADVLSFWKSLAPDGKLEVEVPDFGSEALLFQVRNIFLKVSSIYDLLYEQSLGDVTDDTLQQLLDKLIDFDIYDLLNEFRLENDENIQQVIDKQLSTNQYLYQVVQQLSALQGGAIDLSHVEMMLDRLFERPYVNVACILDDADNPTAVYAMGNLVRVPESAYTVSYGWSNSLVEPDECFSGYDFSFGVDEVLYDTSSYFFVVGVLYEDGSMCTVYSDGYTKMELYKMALLPQRGAVSVPDVVVDLSPVVDKLNQIVTLLALAGAKDVLDDVVGTLDFPTVSDVASQIQDSMQDAFPFCIPTVLKQCLGLLDASPTMPVYQVSMMDASADLDFDAMGLSRLSEVTSWVCRIGFCVLLLVNTRRFIFTVDKGGSDD